MAAIRRMADHGLGCLTGFKICSLFIRTFATLEDCGMDLTPTVLLIEDSADDAFLFTRALKRANLPLQVQVVVEGRDAIEYLKGEGRFHDRTLYPFPRFIITDNRTSGMSGFEFLEWIKAEKDFRMIPVVVMGGSSEPDEIKRAYDLGVHSYIVKPTTLEELENVIITFFTYWSRCQLPPRTFSPTG